MLVALGVLFITLGVLFPTLDLTVAALTSLVVALAFVELGAPYVHLVWICTSLISFTFFSGSPVWLVYFLVFGFYPILKAYIERLWRGVWILLKLVYSNASFALLFLLYELIFSKPFIGEESWFGISGKALVLVALIIMNAAFAAYDMLITVMIRIYVFKYRERFKNLLK